MIANEDHVAGRCCDSQCGWVEGIELECKKHARFKVVSFVDERHEIVLCNKHTLELIADESVYVVEIHNVRGF